MPDASHKSGTHALSAWSRPPADPWSVKIYELHWQRYEHFITGASGALCVYVAQGLTPERADFSPATLERLALLVLVLSFVLSVRRIGSIATTAGCDYQAAVASPLAEAALKVDTSGMAAGNLRAAEQRELAELFKERHAKAEKQATELLAVSEKTEQFRNIVSVGGFLLLLVARVWRAYV